MGKDGGCKKIMTLRTATMKACSFSGRLFSILGIAYLLARGSRALRRRSFSFLFLTRMNEDEAVGTKSRVHGRGGRREEWEGRRGGCYCSIHMNISIYINHAGTILCFCPVVDLNEFMCRDPRFGFDMFVICLLYNALLTMPAARFPCVFIHASLLFFFSLSYTAVE